MNDSKQLTSCWTPRKLYPRQSAHLAVQDIKPVIQIIYPTNNILNVLIYGKTSKMPPRVLASVGQNSAGSAISEI